MKAFDHNPSRPEVPFAPRNAPSIAPPIALPIPSPRDALDVHELWAKPSGAATRPASATPSFRKRTMLTSAVLLVCMLALLSELALSLALPRSDFLQADLRDHPILGQMIAPGDNGHDTLGFRNPVFPPQADIVAIGDSNTYGINARSHESWPGHLQAILGRTTYNAGLGGFGPLHHLHVMRDIAPRFKPKVEVVALYLGNDLLDAYNLAHQFDHWKAYRIGVRPEGSMTDGERLWHEANAGEEHARFLGGLRDWLSMNSMLYSVARHVVLTPLVTALRQKSATPEDPEMKMPWTDPRHPDVKVLFTSKVMLGAEDPGVAQIEEGIRISERALADMAALSQQRGVKLVVGFIPTRERAYCQALTKTGAAMPASHRRLCEVEPATVARLARAAQAAGATVVDTTQAMEAAIERGVKVYPQGIDSHALSAGYRVMAEAIAAVVEPLL